MIQPDFNVSIQQEIYQALLEEKQITARYKSQGSKQCKEYLIHPLGIVNRQGVIYLVCTLWDFKDIKQFALHRFHSAKMLGEDLTGIESFSLESYVKKEQQFTYPINTELIHLKVLFTPGAANHLYETLLTENQQLTAQKNGKILLEATLLDTSVIRWWLGGFGSAIEILEPLILREYFIKEAKELMKNYQ
ncbi:MAG: WYL domain-containing protein [Methylococcaceae bacterium]|nr:WYL domain-containing protein [Methylococcaceae bacterium]